MLRSVFAKFELVGFGFRKLVDDLPATSCPIIVLFAKLVSNAGPVRRQCFRTGLIRTFIVLDGPSPNLLFFEPPRRRIVFGQAPSDNSAFLDMPRSASYVFRTGPVRQLVVGLWIRLEAYHVRTGPVR
jgi:hypothetical protein